MEQITSSRIVQLKFELPHELQQQLDEIKELIRKSNGLPKKQYLRSKDLSKLLGVSQSSLQNLRMAGVLPFKKIQGTILYDYDEVISSIENYSSVKSNDHGKV